MIIIAVKSTVTGCQTVKGTYVQSPTHMICYQSVVRLTVHFYRYNVLNIGVALLLTVLGGICTHWSVKLPQCQLEL